MKKPKVKRYSGEEESYVEDDERDEIGAVSRGLKGVEALKYGIASKAKQEAPEASKAEEADLSPSTFKQAFAEARRSGDKTFTWKGKKYTTELAQPKPAKEAKVERRAEPIKPISSPAKTSKEEISDIVSRTPLRNPQGGIDIKNALRRSQEVGAAAMKESARQARVDRIRRNVGSNLENYGMKKGGKVSSASSRADGAAVRGKTRGRIC